MNINDFPLLRDFKNKDLLLLWDSETQGTVSAQLGELKDYFKDAKVVFQSYFEGANGSTNFVDVKGKVITPVGNAQHSTVQFKTGSSSLFLDGNGDALRVANSADWNLKDIDSRIELGFYRASATNGTLIAQYDTSANQRNWRLGIDNGNLVFGVTNNNASQIASLIGTSPSPNTWHHVAATKSGSVGRLFLDGVQVAINGSFNFFGASTADLTIGSQLAGNVVSTFFHGYIDSVRITRTADFTPSDF